MHGKFEPIPRGDEQRGLSRLREEVLKRKWLLVVVLPTLLLATYYWLIAANQYESEAHFLVRSVQSGPSVPAGIGQAMFGSVGGMNASDRLKRQRFPIFARRRRCAPPSIGSSRDFPTSGSRSF